MDKVSLRFEDVLEGAKNCKTLEQKYGYFQAAYKDLEDYYETELTALRGLVREMGEFVRFLADFPEKYLAIPDREMPEKALSILNRSEVQKIMEPTHDPPPLHHIP